MKLAAGYAAVLGARTTCADETTELGCETRTSPGDSRLTFLVNAGATYSVIVDGVGGSSGPFALDVSVAPSSCGNGSIESPEQCDDGNLVSGDGCSATCAIEATGKLDMCPGLAYTFSGTATAPRTVGFTGDTSALTNSLSSTSCTSTSGFNAIHALTPDIDGSLTLELKAEYANSALYVRRECALNTQEADCAMTATPLVPTKMTIPVRKGATVFAVVDGAAKGGAYVLNATLTPASCGNGIIDGGEDCDDGNTVAGDGCTATCKSEPLTGERCASAESFALTAGTDGSYAGTRAGSTVGMADDYNSCNSGATSGQGDAIFKVDAPVDGFLTATLSPSFYATLDLRKACKDGQVATAADRLACTKSVGTQKTIASGPVRAGTPYFLIVDGNGAGPNATGSFKLDVKVTPASAATA